MNSFSMTKTELAVLFDILGDLTIVTGVTNLAEADENTKDKIVSEFIEKGLVTEKDGRFFPDKGLESFLLPVVFCRKIMIFNYGEKNRCKFNATVYSSEKGIGALLDESPLTVKFYKFDSLAQLLIFLPKLDLAEDEADNKYISYIILEGNRRITHYAKALSDKVVFAEKSEGDSKPYYKESSLSLEDHRDFIGGRIKEVCHVFGG